MKASYNYSEFDNMVESYPMPDHYPPNFIQIEDFCRNVHEWLLMKKDNVAVVHCKAGKVYDED
jgi:phosphatidylinositol-3,4,5-trisphosphate 3-phosphatase and dual-specificity protein phosphatase PTEN